MFCLSYAIIYEKGYQDFDVVTSASLTKMKGVYYRNNVYPFPPIDDVTERIWDVADYVVPAEVNVYEQHDICFVHEITFSVCAMGRNFGSVTDLN